MLQLVKWRVARSAKGRSTLTDFQVSEVHTGRARRLNPSTCEVAKSRRELALSLAGGHAQRALTEGSYTHFVISGIARLGRKSQEFRLANLQDCELRQEPLGIGLGHSVVVARRRWSSHLVFVNSGTTWSLSCRSVVHFI
jgi:hypothetical protein